MLQLKSTRDMNMQNGLTTAQAQAKLTEIGRNEITSKKGYSLFSLLLSQFPTVINGILLTAAIFTYIIGDHLDSTFILAILLLNALFGFIQEYQAEKALEKLKTFVLPLSRVIRNGKEMQIETGEIVPEDIIVLTEGDRVSADGILLSSHHMETDESLLTGESLPVIKEKEDIVYSGTLVTKGKGHVRVTKTGMNTRLGEIAHTLSTIETDQTPLQKHLGRLGNIISVGALLIAFLLVPLGFLRGESLFPLLLLAASVGVAAIPEGLPAVITIALAIGTNRMAKKKAIVRKMQAVETLGAVQVLLIDKTGTFTQNVMRVKKEWCVNTEAKNDMMHASLIGTTASLVKKADDSFEVVGDKTDGALLLWATEQKFTLPNGIVIDEHAFDQVSKTIVTVWDENGKHYVFVRGAPETIVANSLLNKAEKVKVLRLFETYAKEGLRVIAFGKKMKTKMDVSRKNLEHGLTFLGIVGIYDPPRVEAKEYVEKSRVAGVHTLMVTGDNEHTALAIAKEVGLISNNEDVITGSELQRLSDNQLDEVLMKTRIFARTRPEDKLRLVEAFKRLGYIIGVTGDGVNDALALKRSDVGIAMGAKGTDVAKEASDIVLTDDNFSTIVKAIEEGRTIYSNIIKAITYLLAGNLSEISLIFFGAVLGVPTPLVPTQILWMNIVTDGLPALALASDAKDDRLLQEKPRNPSEPILTRRRISTILFLGFSISLLNFFVFIFLIRNTSETFARTIVFNLLVVSHAVLVFVIRGRRAQAPTRFLIFAVAGTLVIQAIITTTPFFQKIFHLGF